MISAVELCASCGMPNAQCKCSPGTRTRSHDETSGAGAKATEAPAAVLTGSREHRRLQRSQRRKSAQARRAVAKETKQAARRAVATETKQAKPVSDSPSEMTRLLRTVEKLGLKIAEMRSEKEGAQDKKEKKKKKHRFEADPESSSDAESDEDGTVSLRKTSPFSKKARSDPIFEYAFRSARRIPRPLPSMVLPAYIKDPYLWICYIVDANVQIDDVVKDRVFQTTAISFSQEVARLFPNRSADVREQFVRVFVAVVCQVRTASLQMNVMDHRDVWATLENLVAIARSLLAVLQRSSKK